MQNTKAEVSWLRIEDNRPGNVSLEGALDIIYRTLAKKPDWCMTKVRTRTGGYGPYVQSERNAQGIYLKYAKQLIEQGDAYYCFCTKERLESLKSQVGDKEIAMYDKHCLHLSKEEVEAKLAARGALRYPLQHALQRELLRSVMTFTEILRCANNELDDLILIKSDGFSDLQLCQCD